ncbi:uncharacterized protein LACBIDRAFT_325288 [Laccaria bicolor S238N-H82]|uniref:Predicted protein n=1 Tax=Laccaria bicolor (strain S238N-H82 / ATCC MYA-4686) TaxID=486041 RepID=B0D4F5_LACBS|nr:uncharacterized protein LACBIDRAFT_325288 [Laccaria bicolor S238N-H82]EDR10336.1 predicted protein [Laccaria bicolor S238N-H82]|eukprot:XP_001878786.1 predicted protein [Laccaria bicolor S238N-H82]
MSSTTFTSGNNLTISVDADSDEEFDRNEGRRPGMVKKRERKLMLKLAISFFLFGLINNAGYSVGYFASGTGVAGLLGVVWWEMRGLGVRVGVWVIIICLSRLFELLVTDSPTSDPCFSTIKWIGPTLLYPVPSAKDHWLLSKIIHSVRDYYPLWQLVYQSTVFLSRSSISFEIPALPQSMLPLLAIIQAIILVVLAYESAVGLFDDGDEVWSVLLVFILISLEEICGSLAYVNVFYRVTHEPPDPNTRNNIERTRQEREFKIGSIGFADSTGILFASIFAVPTELELCKAQVQRGKLLCKGL